mmetsp:Transcript_3793/g.11118  ORF Transcript_3793/g.11118 Transcript_3793/m.11118 type:complete len:518 (+) Transcript_3793:33-1586(+)
MAYMGRGSVVACLSIISGVLLLTLAGKPNWQETVQSNLDDGFVMLSTRPPQIFTPKATAALNKASTATPALSTPQLLDARVHLQGRWFAWCHDGHKKNGHFWFLPDGKTKGDVNDWGLKCWTATGQLEVTLHDCKGNNKHLLFFNCQLSGFFCSAGKQRGYIQGRGDDESPDGVGAPSSDAPPNCSQQTSLAMPMPLPVGSRCNIFTFWDYPDGAPLFARLNLESWRRHSHQLCHEPILVTTKNVKAYIPDMPDEFFRLPYVAAKSDAVRYGLLYHHGGIYLDSDFIVVEDIDEIINRTMSTDLVSYAQTGPSTCQNGVFSSNFMAGRKGSIVHREVWEEQKKLMVGHCPLSEKPLEKVCCFDDETEVCHIPWAGLGEWVSHKVLARQQRSSTPPSTYCFTNERAFVPGVFPHVLDRMLSPDEAHAAFQRAGNPNGLGRVMYHLFNAQFPFKDFTCERLFNNKTAASFLYLRSFSTGHGHQRVPESPLTQAFFKLHPELRQHDAMYAEGRPCGQHGK